jgi:hypothetical protein
MVFSSEATNITEQDIDAIITKVRGDPAFPACPRPVPFLRPP